MSRQPLRLSDCGDVLTVPELCRVLQIGRTQFYELRRHRAFPIKAISGLGVIRFAKVAVEQYLAAGKPAVGHPFVSARRVVARVKAAS